MDTDTTLSEHFNRYFMAEPVRDEAGKREVLQLRHAVYCEELGYEPVREDRQEQDAHDAHSIYALVRHRDSGRAAGCVRLILHPEDLQWRFPFEQVCGMALESGYMPAQRLHATEVSRLAVHQDFRRRRGEHNAPEGGDSQGTASSSDRQYPLIAMGLFLAATALAQVHELRPDFVMMEPRLARLLGSCGLKFSQIGPVLDYHGLRAPFRITYQEVLQTLRPEALVLLESLRQSLR